MRSRYCCHLVAIVSMAIISCGQTKKIKTSANNPILSIPESFYPPATMKVEGHTLYTQKHYPERISQFKLEPLQQNDVVFLGNSITEMGGDWSRRLGKPGIKNRGIGGDIATGVLLRLDEIIYAKPSAVFLLIGINDLLFTNTSPEKLSSTIIQIAKTLLQKSPHTKTFVQTILPTDQKELVADIAETNRLIKKNQDKHVFTLIDVHSLFADENGLMKKELTSDGIHLNEKGYSIWAEKLVQFFK